MEDAGLGFIAGAVVTLLFALFLFHDQESNCQQFYNVADCYWGQTPFLPVVDEAPQKSKG